MLTFKIIARTLSALGLLVVLFALGAVLVSAQPTFNPFRQAPALGPSGQKHAGTSNAATGALVQAQYSPTAPQHTQEQIKQTEALTERANRAIQGSPRPEVAANLNKNPEQVQPGKGQDKEALDSNAPLTQPGDFKVFRNKIISPQPNVSGRTGEPSTGANGKNVFQTGNWYAGRSFDDGASWGFLDPYTIFGSTLNGFSFCCDQVTLYDPGRDTEFWLLQFGDGSPGGGFKIANSRGSDLFTSWCYWNVDATWVGYQNATDAGFDYNEMALGRDYLYITTNIFPSGGGSGSVLIRLPIDPMITCSGFSYNYDRWTADIDPGWATSLVPVQGSEQGTIYYASSNNQNLGDGDYIRVMQWDENSGTPFYWNIDVDDFNYMYRNSGQNCASADGVVVNWCQFNDSRMKSGALAYGTLWFALDVTQGSGYPFPYSKVFYVRASDKAYLGYSDVWASWGAFQYTEVAPNSRGDIGWVTAWGGGTEKTHYYPSGGVLIADQFSPSQPWQRSDVVFGGGNPCKSSGLYRWGDYFTVRNWDPTRLVWIATIQAIEGANCGSAGWFNEQHNVVFGRSRYKKSYTRWNSY